MGYWSRFVSTVGGERIVAGLGGLYVAVAVARAGFVVATGRPILAAVIDFVLVGGPGAVLLYGGVRLPRIDLDSDTYPRVVTWCLAGFVVTLGVIELLNLEPGVTIAYPRWSFTLGAAIGTAAGFGIGVNDARAVTQRREAERHNRQLQRRNGQLENFARMVAHELKNPLTIAKIYLGPATDGDPKAVEEVETALDRIEEMIEVVLVTARGEDATIHAEPVSLSDVAAETWDSLDPQHAELAVETDRTVLADPIHLRHLLENLFENAVEHTESAVEITVGPLPDGFYVADDGVGIPEHERDAVFEAGHTTDADGIGLGLTFISQLAETYGWDCTLTESEAGGARFEFTNVDFVTTEERTVH
ncbi:ATP-binding protein [Halorussus gelatinilyticus]|uniref:histidine kinase n=1 Tax=Halorussus gelatinilyticus TaxID=2937524 RepID=A0A8U0ILZ0_9EURY|nr:ATP-binding protein [Halorussus gelatinilyticus]UPW02153.1 ATP-binding protein [Halorussus gelatinilyticus]